MLPPIEDSILEANPKFAALQSTLAKSVLNLNGSNRNHAGQRERNAVKEELVAARTRCAKTQLIKSSLRDLDLSPPSSSTTSKSNPSSLPKLPTELIELVILLSSHLNTTPLNQPSLEALKNTSQWQALPTYLPQLSSLLSSHLQGHASALTRIQFPTTNASYLHRSIPKLVPAVQDLQAEITSMKIDMETRRIGLVSKISMLLGLYHLASTLVILHLEQSVHGSLSRHLKARSEYLALRAREVEFDVKEKKAKGERMVYTDAVTSALREYLYSLKDARERMKERKKEVDRGLWAYGIGRRQGEGGSEKEKVMRAIAAKYEELQKELSDVKSDVERLKGR